MYCEDGYLGCPGGAGQIRITNDKLNMKVVDQVNESQELVQLNNFAREVNESLFKKCLEQRIADIESWRWVFGDLTKRLEEAVATLEYEHRALRVVVERIREEINNHSREESRPGALCPSSDMVEEAILQEYKFLREHKRKFEELIPLLERKMTAVKRTKKRIDADIVLKAQALAVEHQLSSSNINPESCKRERSNKKKKRGSPVNRWESRCILLKKAGLWALSNAAITRQQVRGARVHLSIAAQAYAARVDSALRRRLHSNKIKLQDMKWQREEIQRDYKSLEDEMITTEQNFLENMHQEQVIEARLIDRTLRPPGELTRDEVDMKLRDELARLRSFSKQLRINIDRIGALQNHLVDSMSQIDCYTEDIQQVVCIDEDRISARQGELPECNYSSSHEQINQPTLDTKQTEGLTSIREEDEDDYPFRD